MNQASDTLQETHATRRAIDSKIHSLLALASGLLGLLVAFGVWTRLRPIGQAVFVAALVVYMFVVALGLFAYYPRRIPIPFAGAILEFQDIAYDDLLRVIAQGTVELVQENAREINRKSSVLEIMLLLIVLSSSMLVISVIV